ncbi:unnamed protein product [Rotaria sp. Silwood1]|nr:unnamed protein product [Rotaria sp. Silwood1]CAF5033957.1 unnamed protein product [Rotaria sp. Silwood1]
MIAKTELDRFRASVGELMSVHSFFSTTPDYLMSYGFTHAREGLVSVLFEIEMSTSLIDVKPFADISELSYMPGEKEILFVLGAIFRIVSIEDYPDMYWVKLQLCSDNETELKSVLDRLRSRISEKTSVEDFAIVLYEMGLLDKAKETFEQMLTKCPSNHPDMIRIYRFLGQIADEQGHYDQAIDLYNQTMGLEDELLSSEDPERAKTFNNLALVYKAIGEHNKASTYFEKALAIWKNADDEHRENIARCLNNLGSLFGREQPRRALDYFEQALAIRRQFLPANDVDIAENLGNIGGIHGILGNYEQALTYAEQTLAMLANTLPSMSAKMADAYRNVGVAHANLGDYQQALQFYHKAAVIIRQIMESDHPRRLQIEQDIRRMTLKRAYASFNGRFDRALAHLLSADITKQTDISKDNNK